MKELFDQIKNGELNFGNVTLSIVLSVMVVMLIIINSGHTYALTGADYDCPLGGGTPVYSEIHDGVMGYYCAFGTVEVATSNFKVGDSVKDDADCIAYINEVGGYELVTTDAGFYCTYVAVYKNKFTITFNANGGEGAPASQTVLRDGKLVLSQVEPTREGYTFLGWSKDKN